MLHPACRARLAILIAGLVVSGCQSNSSQPAPAQPAGVSADFSKVPPPASGSQVTPDSVLASDPSASRLQDIGGYIMLYYRGHQQMPPSLNDLASLPGGQGLNFNSASGEPFEYQAAGMWSPERSDKCIIAYDPELRNGKRWVLFMTLPKTGKPLDVDVYDLPEPFF